MQIVNKIDHLITELTKLKPTLSDDRSNNEKRFSDLLTSSLENDRSIADNEIDVKFSKNAKPENEMPSWVDSDYGYDPQNPRKPNMRELMEAMSGNTIEDLYKEPEENWQKISRHASEMLYGVINTNKDSRDWPSILSSNNILKEARRQTGVMHKPEVGIQSNFNDDGIMIEQIAVIKDSNGNTLRSLSTDTISAEETLLNFGATKESVPTNLEERIDPEKFDDNLLAFLKNFGKSPTSVQQLVVQSSSEAIAKKIAQEIPLDELAKL